MLLSGLILIATIAPPVANTAHGGTTIKSSAGAKSALTWSGSGEPDRTSALWDDRHDYDIAGFDKSDPSRVKKRRPK